MAGDVPLNIAMPAIGISHVDSVPQLGIQVNEANQARAERVQVTVFRKLPPDDDGYPGLQSLIDLVTAACASTYSSVNGTTVQGIRPDTEGPDFSIEGMSIITRSKDFIVRWVG